MEGVVDEFVASTATAWPSQKLDLFTAVHPWHCDVIECKTYPAIHGHSSHSSKPVSVPPR
jgi:hypothetical protein